MAALKCPCPRCLLPLQIVKSPPAAVTCPRCGLHFTVAGDGSTAHAPAAAEMLTESLDAPTEELDLVPQPRLVPRRRRFLVAVLGAAAVAVGGLVSLCTSRPQVDPRPAAPSSSGSVKAPHPPPGLTSAASVKGALPRVDQATLDRRLDRGVAYLKAWLTRAASVAGGSGARPGDVALAGLALLSCGVPGESVAVRYAAAQVRAAAPKVRTTYDLAVCTSFLDRLGLARDRELVRALGLQLIAGQRRGGGWDAHCDPLEPAQEQQLLALLRGPQDGSVADGLPSTLSVFAFRTGQVVNQAAGSAEDNFLTQFALLGLWAARKHGVPVERSLAFAAARFRASQNTGGSWGYAWGTRACEESLTGTGLFALAAEATPRDLAGDVHAAKALAFLGECARRGAPPGVDRSPADLLALLQIEFRNAPEDRQRLAHWMDHIGRKRRIPADIGQFVGSRSLNDLYYLWSLARVAQVYGLDTLGGTDWYAWGAGAVLVAQNADGSWSAAFPGLAEASFALLFLRRDGLVPGLTVGRSGTGARPLAPAELAPTLLGRSKPAAVNWSGNVKASGPPTQ